LTPDLFESLGESQSPSRESLGPGAVVLRAFASASADALLAQVEEVVAQAPLRHMLTPGGLRMSVAMTNCGALGWVSDRGGYRYDGIDPDSGRPWPRMPDIFARLAFEAASQAGFDGQRL